MAAKRVTPSEVVVSEIPANVPQVVETTEEDLTTGQIDDYVCEETGPVESVEESSVKEQPQRVIPYSEWRDEVLASFIPDIPFKVQGETLKRPTPEQLFELTKLVNNHRVVCLGAGMSYKHLDVNKTVFASDVLEYLNSLIVSWED